MAQFEVDARQGAWEILSGKGYTSYGIANQAYALCRDYFTKYTASLTRF
ncbi:hypothetical protein QY890_02735 [Latilactobacillus sakei]